MLTERDLKNQRIAESNRQTRLRRQSQVPLTFELGVRNEKRNRKNGCLHHLKMICVEAKWMKNMITGILNEDKSKKITDMKDKDFKTVTHFDKDGNQLVSELEYLKSSLRLGVITEYKWNLAALSAAKKKGRKVGRIKFESDHKTVIFLQNGITHHIDAEDNTIRIQGFEYSIRVSGLKQLRKLTKDGLDYEVTMLKLHMVNDTCFKFFLTVYVDREQYNALQEQKRKKRVEKRIKEGKTTHDTNAFDFGCIDTAVDAYSNKYNVQFEETKRLKRLQQKLARQRQAAEKKAESSSEKSSGGKTKGRKKKPQFTNSVRRYDTLQRLKKEHYRISRRKDAAAIDLALEILDMNETVIMQDEQLANWKRKKKCTKKNGQVVMRRGSGRVIQHGIHGRLKQRLKASPKTHIIDKWVPTTKLCTWCGKMHRNIKLSDRRYVCPNCKHDCGDRDVHSGQTMIWLYYYMPSFIGLDGSEFKRRDFDESLAEIFSAENPCSLEQASRSQKEDAMLPGDISPVAEQNPDKEIFEG